LHVVRQLSCDEMHGFLCSKPLSLEEFDRCLRAGALAVEPGNSGPLSGQSGCPPWYSRRAAD
jgi:hypothetical protein